MKRKFNQFLAAVMLVSALTFSGCTKDSAPAPESKTAGAAEIGSSAKASTSSSEAREYTFYDVEVELNDIGRKNLIEKGYSRMKQKADGGYITDVNNPWDPPYDPIICDGMTYSQLWADIMNRWNNFKNSPQGQNAQNYANATCRPVYYCICNCGVCVMFIIEPTRRCYVLAEELNSVSAVKAQLIAEPTP
jgi:hypothetical protein